METQPSSFLSFSKTYPDWAGHLAFSEPSCIDWSIRFSVNSHWRVHPEFGEDSRKVLVTLSPPFYPEDEFIIWDPGVDKSEGSGVVFINRIISPRLNLDEGLCFGTDFRIIWGNRHKGMVAQILYKEIVGVEREEKVLRLLLHETETLEILFEQSLNEIIDEDKNNGKRNEFNPIELLENFFRLIVEQNHMRIPNEKN